MALAQALVGPVGLNRPAGLKVYAQLDQRDYPQGTEVTDAQLAAVNLTRDDFHGEWKYTIKPSPK